VRKLIILIAIYGYFNRASSQNPYHFYLGTDLFASVDIYGINQTPDGAYWFASNRGLYSYNGYEFKNYQSPLQLSNSVFNLQVDYEGKIYCNNLNGQIFKIVNDSLKLIHSISDNINAAYSNYNFLTDNSIYVRGYQSYQLKEGEKIDLRLNSTNLSTHTRVTKDCENRLLTHVGLDSLYRIDTDGIERFYLSGLENIDYKSLTFFCHKEQVFATNSGKQIFLLRQISDHEMRLVTVYNYSEDKARFYSTDTHIWFAENVLGVAFYNYESSQIKSIFPDQFISYVFEDNSGNLLLGTFGEGIIVIPQIQIEDNLFPDLDLTHFTMNESGGLYLADKIGNVYFTNGGEPIKIFKTQSSRIELLEYFPTSQELFLMGDRFVSYSTITQDTVAFLFGAVKTIERMGQHGYAMFSSSGLILKDSISSQVNSLKMGRGYSLAFRDSSNFYAGSLAGLKRINLTNSNVNEIQLDGKNIVARQLNFLDSTLIVGSTKDGLLKLDKDQLVTFIDEKSGLYSHTINQIRIHKGVIYVATNAGFQAFDRQGELIGSLGKSDGLTNTNIKDFRIFDSTFYFLHTVGLQKIPLSHIFKSENNLEQIDAIKLKINGQPRSLQNDFSIPHTDNQLTFEIYAPSLERQSDISYHYRLIGLDSTWNKQPYDKNGIEYKALAPGTYQFEVLLKLKGIIQGKAQIDFIIKKPFWQTAWFIFALIVLIIVLSYLFFRRRIKRLKQRTSQLKELNDIKLQALQAQLDPHFVFNALNCVQNMVLEGNVMQTNDYLVKFANLMRKVLENSRKKYIPLEQEIEVVKTYMALQELYYKNGFSYQITIDEQIDTESFMIPPMFIQPFLENALEHGMLGDSGFIKINISLRGELINIQITDNGIGLSEARKNKNPEHKSLATDIIKERIDNYNEQYRTNIKLLVYEMKNENDKILGTRVAFDVPFEKIF